MVAHCPWLSLLALVPGQVLGCDAVVLKHVPPSHDRKRDAMNEDQAIASPAPDAIAGDPEPQDDSPPALIESELLVEDVSIDGMCGVY